MRACPKCHQPIEYDEAVCCPDCGAILEGEAKMAEAEAPDVCLEVNENNFYMETYQGVFEFRIRNFTDKPLKKMLVTLSSPLLERPINFKKEQFKPGMVWDKSIGGYIEEKKAGVSIVRFYITYESGGLKKTFKGKKLIIILRQTNSLPHVVIDLKDSINIVQKGEYGVFQEAKVNLEENRKSLERKCQLIEQLMKDGLLETPNDLMKKKWSPNFMEVPLELVEVSPSLVITLDERFGLMGQSLEKATLRCQLGEMSKNYLLLSSSLVQFGRNQSSKNHVVLRLMPYQGNPENQERTRAISGEHFQIIYQKGKGMMIMDLKSTNGTFLNGHRLEPHEEVGLRDGDIISLGQQILQLQFSLFHRPFPYQLQLEGLPLMLHPDLGIDKEDCIDCVKLKRLNNLQEEEYIIMIKKALIGSSETNSIVIPPKGVRDEEAMIFFYGGRYFFVPLENSTGCMINEVPLQPLKAVPLSLGKKIDLGKVQIIFDKFGQLHLS